jgi:hypothetical protein
MIYVSDKTISKEGGAEAEKSHEQFLKLQKTHLRKPIEETPVL